MWKFPDLRGYYIDKVWKIKIKVSNFEFVNYKKKKFWIRLTLINRDCFIHWNLAYQNLYKI